MCMSCFFDEFHGLGGRRGRYISDGDIDRAGFAPVSRRAMSALDNAKRVFLHHLATVDTSRGPVTAEIIKFHLVPDMRKAFTRFVREFGCIAIFRQLTRDEQDLVNKTRKSLMWHASVKVTPEAKLAYLEKNPQIAGKLASASSTTAVHCTAKKEEDEEDTKPTVLDLANGSPVPQPQPSGEMIEVRTQKIKHKLNEAAVKHAASSPSIKKLHASKA